LENGRVKYEKYALFIPAVNTFLNFVHFRRLAFFFVCQRSDALHYFLWCYKTHRFSRAVYTYCM